MLTKLFIVVLVIVGSNASLFEAENKNHFGGIKMIQDVTRLSFYLFNSLD